ncbi:ankyrin repeat domain-containing protein 16-like [Mizuhopecten yessoensis]|uniref:ankyrin repeat domain-containing protein 16-like n=1 Tax=Mizuhopecten yessoensis TaxID=6573 RepID=UPI000B459D24|nr:ankyrin repeat domain-containing protein 16-like [Mizuhopecten yessoensis]XP_021376457.1 ankyrin repeat domain-containing protein 16-like [Mizuhopecten yessoensis]
MPSNQDLFKAAFQGNLTFFKELQSCDVGSHDTWLTVTYPKSGDNLLHCAARLGHVHLLKFLHEAGANLELPNFDGKRPLHEAAQAGHLDCVKYLLSQDVSVDSLKRADWTPLMLASVKLDQKVIQVLIHSGADPCLRNKDGWNSFHLACREGVLSIVKFFHNCNGDLGDTVSKNGRTPLHTTALHGRYEVASFLLEHCGYSVDMKDSCGSTPFMDAMRSGHVNVGQLLFEKQQASVDVVDNVGFQSIHQAAQAGQEGSVRYLVETRGLEVDTLTTAGSTALAVASKEGQLAVLECLLGAGAKVNSVDTKGRSALHIASGAQHADCVKVLLHHGAVLAPDGAGKTPEQLAKKDNVIQMFKEHISNLDES